MVLTCCSAEVVETSCNILYLRPWYERRTRALRRPRTCSSCKIAEVSSNPIIPHAEVRRAAFRTILAAKEGRLLRWTRPDKGSTSPPMTGPFPSACVTPKKVKGSTSSAGS